MKSIKKFGLISMMVMSFFMFVSCGQSNEIEEVPKEATKGYIWEATKGDDSIYLVGTMHPAPKDVNFFNDKINEIIEKTDAVALEIDQNDPKVQEESIKYQNNNYLMKSGELKDLLTAEECIKLDEVLADHKLEYKNVKHLNIDGLAMTLNSRAMQIAGFTGEIFDNALSSRYKDEKKEVVELENVIFQLETLKVENSVEAFKKSLAEYDKKYIDESIKQAEELFEGYRTGDKSIAENAVAKHTENPEFYKKLIVDRNINMTEKIDVMAQEDKEYMVAVGYLHYFGEDSILKLLEAKGYTIKEVI